MCPEGDGWVMELWDAIILLLTSGQADILMIVAGIFWGCTPALWLCDGSGAGGAVIAICQSRDPFYRPLCGVAFISGCCSVSLPVSFLLWFPPSNSHAIVILIGLRKTKCNRVSNEVFWFLKKRGSLVLEEMRQTGRVGKSRVKSIFSLLLWRCFHYPSSMLHDRLIFVISVKFQHSGISPKL